MGGEEAIEGDAVRGVDGVAPERCERVGGRRGPPVHPSHRDALSDQRRREQLGADDDRPQRIAEEIGLR